MAEVTIVPAAARTVTDRPARKVASPAARALRWASLLQSFASLLWAPQAALLSVAVVGMANGAGVRDAVLPALGIVVFGVLRALCDAAGSRIAFRAARDELSRLRASAAEALARRSPLDIARPPSGLAASVLAEQAETVVPYLSRFQPARMRALLVPLVLLACIVPFSWAAGLILAIAAPLIPLFMALIGWGAKAASEEQLVELGGMNAFLLDRLRGLATLRSLGAVDATARRLRADAESLRRRTMVVLRIAFLSSAVLELLSALGVAMVAGYIGFHLLGVFSFGSWGGPIGLGHGLFILLLAPAFFEPLRELSAVWHDRASGQAALGALTRLAEEGARIVGTDAPGEARDGGAPSLDLHAVTFRHEGGGAAVFERFDLRVAPGEHVALFAPSGAGKSTLLALLAGLAHPEEGQVVIGGEVMTDANAGRLRARMAYIGQSPHIFAGTLSGNVGLGRAAMGREEIAGALDAARLGDVAAMRGPAPVGEGGRGLSGGEALRLALARLAVHREADIILADEPTAHLDSVTAAEVSDALMELARGRTLVLATHDAHLAARMDRIVSVGGEARA